MTIFLKLKRGWIAALFCCLFGMFAHAAQASDGILLPGLGAYRAHVISATPLPSADEIIVYKSKRLLYLMKNGRILRKFPIVLGQNPVGHKLEWGDLRTPEGKYHIDMKNAASGYFLSLRVSYPDSTDANVATALEVKPGDWVMIHGMPNNRTAEQMQFPRVDWTNGCIAMRNEDIAELWRRVPVGTPISIWP